MDWTHLVVGIGAAVVGWLAKAFSGKLAFTWTSSGSANVHLDPDAAVTKNGNGLPPALPPPK